MLAHLSRKQLVRLDVRTGEAQYVDAWLRWSGDRCQGSEFEAPVGVVIDVGRAFTMTFDGKLYLTGDGKAQYQTFTPDGLLMAARRGYFGFTLLWDEAEESMEGV